MRPMRSCLLLGFGTFLGAAEPLVLVVHPNSPVQSITRAEAASLFKGESLFLGGKKATLVLPKASSKSLPALSYTLIKMGIEAYSAHRKQVRLQGVPFDPQFVDTGSALESMVAANPQCVGMLLKSESTGGNVRLLPIPD